MSEELAAEVDPRTLPVGAVFRSIVELRHLAAGEWLQFAEHGWGGAWAEGQMCQATGQSAKHGTLWVKRADGLLGGWDPACRIIRVPAPSSAAPQTREDWEDLVVQTVVEAIREVANRALRWQTTDPTRIAALEAKLAGQVASGGQDCGAARSLLERADGLRREAEARRHPLTQGDSDGRARVMRYPEPYLQPGPRLMRRHELAESQRLNRNRSGR